MPVTPPRLRGLAATVCCWTVALALSRATGVHGATASGIQVISLANTVAGSSPITPNAVDSGAGANFPFLPLFSDAPVINGSDEWTLHVCTHSDSCNASSLHAFSKTGRRLAPKAPSSSIQNTFGKFQGQTSFDTLTTFATDIIDSGALAAVGMVCGFIMGPFQTGFSDVWETIVKEQTAKANMVMKAVQSFENKDKLTIEQNLLNEVYAVANAFTSDFARWNASSSKGSLSSFCEGRDTQHTFEQVSNSGRVNSYLGAAQDVCLTDSSCVEKIGFSYVLNMILPMRNALICANPDASSMEMLQTKANQAARDVSLVANTFINGAVSVKTKFVSNTKSDGDKASFSLDDMWDAVIAQSNIRDKVAKVDEHAKYFDWLEFKVFEYTSDDQHNARGACGVDFRFESLSEDVNGGIRHSKDAKTVLVWGHKGTISMKSDFTAGKRAAQVEDFLNQYRSGPGFGAAVIPTVALQKGTTRRSGTEFQSPGGDFWYNCKFIEAVYVSGTKFVDPGDAKSTSGDADSSVVDEVSGQIESSESSSITPEGMAEYFNSLIDENGDIADGFASSELAEELGRRDPAVLTGGELGLEVIDRAKQAEFKQMDDINARVDSTHEEEMKALDGISTKLDVTHGKEMQGLTDLQNTVTSQHEEELGQYDKIDGHVSELERTIDSGFAAANSAVDSVTATVVSKLDGLDSHVVASGEETRRVVGGVLQETTRATLGALDSLSSNIARVNQATITQVSEVHSLIVQKNQALRSAIEDEFYKRQVQVQNGVVETTNIVIAAARATTNALLGDVDLLQNELSQRLVRLASKVGVVKGRIVHLEEQLLDARKQVDKMLRLLGSIQQKTDAVFKTVQAIPQMFFAELFTQKVDRLMEDHKKLNYAFSKYIENGMTPLYRFELQTACTSYARLDDLFTSFLNIAGVSDRTKMIKHFKTFAYDRVAYERFGGEILIAAYGIQRLSLTCLRLDNAKGITKEKFIAQSRVWDGYVDAALSIYQLNIEEVIPEYFLQTHYTAAVVIKEYLAEERADYAGRAGKFPIGAIEQLRYRLQQQVGSYASISVFNVPVASSNKLKIWSAEKAGTVAGKNRYGMLDLSDGADRVVILWGNTQEQIPSSVRTAMTSVELPVDLTAETLSAAFSGSIWELYWNTGTIRSVVRSEKIEDGCPWATAESTYPLCWETYSACNCVQLEGIPDTPTADDMTLMNAVPTYYTLKTSFTDVKQARSDFQINATYSTVMGDLGPPSADKLLSTEMRGIPSNRIRFAACMSSPLPTIMCEFASDKTIGCHQPPPKYTRCIADPRISYDIMDSNGTEFVFSGSSVTTAMFKSLKLGDTVPAVSFFDKHGGKGNYIVCSNCDLDDLQTVYMFPIMSFKIGRPTLEKTAVCQRHPRLDNVEYCPEEEGGPSLWTPTVLLETEMTRRVQQIGRQLPQGMTDRHDIAMRVSAGLSDLLDDTFSFFKVYIGVAGSFNTSTNGENYWTSLPNHAKKQERGWSVVSPFYTSVVNSTTSVAMEALVMWGTLPVDERNFAQLVVQKKPSSASLKSYLESTFRAYKDERVLRGFFSEAFTGLDCPVAGDTDHFAYCTPEPVDGVCMCIQLEDLPEEYRVLYAGSAPNGKVVSFTLGDATDSPFVVGRSKGPFSLGSKVAVAEWDGFPARNVSEAAFCLSDYNAPELGATCILQKNTDYALRTTEATFSANQDSGVTLGDKVETVRIESKSWSALCTGCAAPFIAQIVRYSSVESTVTLGGLIAGGFCQRSPAEGGGNVLVCTKAA